MIQKFTPVVMCVGWFGNPRLLRRAEDSLALPPHAYEKGGRHLLMSRHRFGKFALRTLAWAFCVGLLLGSLDIRLNAADRITGKLSGSILAAGDRRVMILSPVGEVVWEYPTKLTHDAWMLANGNVLFADGETVTEVTPAKKIAFQYRAAEQQGGGTYACQRLDNGNTMVGENSTGRILELNADGKVVFSLQTTPYQPKNHHNLRMARKLENGNYLVCHSGARMVKEYTPKGEIVWEVKAPGALAFAAIRTARGTTLVSSLDQVTEYDATGKTIWECSVGDIAGASVRNLTGMHLLDNGNIVVGCYQAYKNGQGCGLLEISREKQLVWQYANLKGDGTMMAVQTLSAEGKPLPGDCRR